MGIGQWKAIDMVGPMWYIVCDYRSHIPCAVIDERVAERVRENFIEGQLIPDGIAVY